MSENGGRRRPRVLSPETKWEIFLQVTSRDVTQAEAARKWHVDVSTIIGIRRTVKDAAMAALTARPGRPAAERNWELEQARGELAQLTEAQLDNAVGRPPVDRLGQRPCSRRGVVGALVGGPGERDSFSFSPACKTLLRVRSV